MLCVMRLPRSLIKSITFCIFVFHIAFNVYMLTNKKPCECYKFVKMVVRACVCRQGAVMSFKRKFTTPTKMAAGNEEDDDVTGRGFDSRPSSGRASDPWPATLFPGAVADAGRPRTPRTLSPHRDRERKTDGGDAWREPEVDGDDDVMGNIRSVIGSASTLDEKQRVLTMMISQLQSLKQNLFQQKSNGVSCH